MIYLNARLRLVSTKRINTTTDKPMTTSFGYADMNGESEFLFGPAC